MPRGFGSARDPGPSLAELVEMVEPDLAGGGPREDLERLAQPVDVGDDRRSLPRRAVPEAEAQAGLHVLIPGAGFEALEIVQLEQHPDLAGLGRFTQDRLEDVR